MVVQARPKKSIRAAAGVDLERLWRAICLEAGNNPMAFDVRTGRAGVALLSREYVDDCNLIAGARRWRYDDRYDPDRCFAMFVCYVRHYAPTGGPEALARVHFGGPYGDRAASDAYWRRIEAMIC